MEDYKKVMELYEQLPPEKKTAFLIMLQTTLNMILLTVQQNKP